MLENPGCTSSSQCPNRPSFLDFLINPSTWIISNAATPCDVILAIIACWQQGTFWELNKCSKRPLNQECRRVPVFAFLMPYPKVTLFKELEHRSGAYQHYFPGIPQGPNFHACNMTNTLNCPLFSYARLKRACFKVTLETCLVKATTFSPCRRQWIING